MQSAVVKLMGNKGLFKLKGQDENKVKIHPQDKMCMLVDFGKITKLKDNTELEGGVLQANQTVIIRPNVSLTPTKYHAVVSYNPALTLGGAIVTPLTIVVRPGEEDMVGLLVRPTKNLDINELTHIFELYQID